MIELDYEALIDKKRKSAMENGIVILKPMSGRVRYKLNRLIWEYDDLTSFNIGSGNERRIVMRYVPHKKDKFDFANLKNRADEFYNQNDYKNALIGYQKLLEAGSPPPVVYLRTGISYLKTGSVSVAIDYLTVARELYLESKKEFLYEDLLLSLKENVPLSELKGNVKFEVAEFKNYAEDELFVEGSEVYARELSQGKPLHELMMGSSFTEEQKAMLYLQFAKDCYYQEKYDMGDIFLEMATKTKNKTDKVKKLLSEIRTNRLFYKNRQEQHKSLILTNYIKK